MALFDDLKTKYKPVIETIQSEGVQVENLHVQDNKLFIKGVAPSADAANRVWDAIKRINPRADDIIADFPVDASRAPAPAPAQARGPQMYTVKPGDTLSKISQQFYGSSNDYMRIFNANKDQLKDPDQIKPGQMLKIPPAA